MVILSLEARNHPYLKSVWNNACWSAKSRDLTQPGQHEETYKTPDDNQSVPDRKFRHLKLISI
jgi:hypothetical protein